MCHLKFKFGDAMGCLSKCTWSLTESTISCSWRAHREEKSASWRQSQHKWALLLSPSRHIFTWPPHDPHKKGWRPHWSSTWPLVFIIFISRPATVAGRWPQRRAYMESLVPHPAIASMENKFRLGGPSRCMVWEIWNYQPYWAIVPFLIG